MRWPWSPKHYDHDAERGKFLNSIPKIAALGNTQPIEVGQAARVHTPTQSDVDASSPSTLETPATPVGASMSFIGVLEAIGKGFEKGLVWAIKYAVPVEKLVGLIFPPALPVTTEIVDATTLIQNAVLLVEQKYAAAGVQSGTGAQKSAEVLALTEQAVTGLLTKAGVTTATTDYIQSIINAVVAILNVQGFVAAPAPTVAAA